MASAPVSKPISNIAMAFAGKSSLDVPEQGQTFKPTLPTFSVPNQAFSGQGGLLPTPPNSISPTLPPHKVRALKRETGDRLHLATPISTPSPNPPDSDLDLQDVSDGASQVQVTKPQPLSKDALSGLESAAAITPQMLAKHHLPAILLTNGPIAIRHILAHLTQTVPGFSRIPGTKARRLVVGALESRSRGGADGDVIFEKVGWGRWDARKAGQPARERTLHPPTIGSIDASLPERLAFSPPPSVGGSYTNSHAGGLHIPKGRMGGRTWEVSSYGRRNSSWAESGISRDDEAMYMAEHEADKMSLDGEEKNDATSDDFSDSNEEDSESDMTDEEDWAAIGAAALRQNNLPFSSRVKTYPPRRLSAQIHVSSLSQSGRRGSSVSSAAQALSLRQWQQTRGFSNPLGSWKEATPLDGILEGKKSMTPNFGLDGAMDVDITSQDPKERAAVEALMQMGSM
ncbi:hypothetical protein K402DRAFT_334808 [Aulographum hederae CBS 113979]|uniref:Sin3 binding protein-domain-containing protein n=1 Tax=Aulographum hederae CBS 113979 TaxID=1176131 RepID=A0A6G1GWV4_9PEZI|nr:hypothetical protein K402DRAFT_334808 [Aulographum hederae CBS 113979]